MLHAWKHRKVSVAKASVATEQKSAVPTNVQTSFQLISVSTEAKSISREARQVPREPKTSQTKQVWKAKQKAPREALGEAKT